MDGRSFSLLYIERDSLPSPGETILSKENVDIMFISAIKNSDFQMDRLEGNPLNMYIIIKFFVL